MAEYRLRVLHLLRTLDRQNGGPVTYLVVMAQASKLAGIESSAAAFSGQHAPPTDVTPIRFRYAGAGLIRWFEQDAGAYDVAHLHGIFNWPLFLGSAIAMRRRVPFVVSTMAICIPGRCCRAGDWPSALI